MKNKTIICHFYNEEYLLPWWLNHHKRIFSNGLMINYGSDDGSIDLIKTICPNWKIVNTKNKYFGAIEIDQEIQEYEKDIEGQRIILNVTEFLIGNISVLEKEDSDLYIPMASMIDKPEEENTFPRTDISLTSQRFYGINPFKRLFAGSRILHSRKDIQYPTGRHYWNICNTKDFMILRYKHSPWNDMFIKRKMQIGHKQPKSDLERGWGRHHQFSRDELEKEKNEYFPLAENLYDIIKSYEYWSY